QAAGRQCTTLVDGGDPVSPPPSPALPPMRVGLDGGPYSLDASCSAVLGRLAGDPDAPAAETGRWARAMRKGCPDFLAAVERRIGVDATQDRFWPQLGELALNGFAPPAAPQTSMGVAADPGFQRMCREAQTNQQKCEQRQQ